MDLVWILPCCLIATIAVFAVLSLLTSLAVKNRPDGSEYDTENAPWD